MTSVAGEAVEIPATQPTLLKLERYRDYLRGKFHRGTRGYQGRLEASDLVQQTLMEAHLKISQFRGRTEAEMARWLAQILKHNIADAARALRRQKRDVTREQSLEAGVDQDCRPAADWLASEQTTPSLCAANAEQFLQLSEAISKLPPTQREVIVLHHLQGQTLSELAACFQRSEASVAGLLYRGLKSLRELMAQQPPEN